MTKLPIDDLNNGQYNDAHHLLELKEIPASLEELRRQLTLPENTDIRDYAIQGASFQECIARVATFLSIVLDGDYDVGPLCEVLVNAITSRNLVGAYPHLSDERLVNAEIVEKEGEVTLQVSEEAGLELPKLIMPIDAKEIN